MWTGIRPASTVIDDDDDDDLINTNTNLNPITIL